MKFNNQIGQGLHANVVGLVVLATTFCTVNPNEISIIVIMVMLLMSLCKGQLEISPHMKKLPQKNNYDCNFE